MRTIILVLVIAAIVGSIYYLNSTKTPIAAPQNGSVESLEISVPPRATSPLSAETVITLAERVAQKEKKFERGKEIVSPSGFINADKFALKDLVGKKVILIDFWTYSCINCIRTFPYLNAWYDKYKDRGLEIVGIHTPEFEFEKKYDNVATAVKNFGIKYPVVLDNDYATWFAYKNRYWPREYLIDIDGFIVHDHIGEGSYEETESEIQKALAERALVLGENEKIAKETVRPTGVIAVNPGAPLSPEIYFGAARNEYLGNGARRVNGPQTLTEPSVIKLNTPYLVGDWNFTEQYAENKSSAAKIIFKYQAKNVYLVAGASVPVTIKILKDGKSLGDSDKGEDVVIKNGESAVAIQAERLYKLIQGADWGEHTIELIIESPGVRTFTFTFG